MRAETLVVFSLEPWDTVWRRNQYLIDGLLRADPTLRVLFVEPSRDLLHDVVSRRRPKRGAGQRTAAGYGGRLVLFQPTKWLPRILGPLADALLRRSVGRTLRSLRVRAGLLWVNDPGWATLVERTNWPALYDMTDDWLAADRGRREHARVVANEEILMRRCAAVVVCSPGLYESRRGKRSDVILIPNAVDLERYRRPGLRPADLPDGRIALYVGTLHEDRLDVDLVVRTGAALHELGAWCILVGPNALSGPHTAMLQSASGVLLLGARAYEAIPAYLQHADVLLVPHVVSEFTDSLDPLKLYEYRAVGHPIVSTPVAGFRELASEPGVLITEPDAFPETAARTAANPSKRGADLVVPDWSDRVQTLAAVIAQLRDDRVAHPLTQS